MYRLYKYIDVQGNQNRKRQNITNQKTLIFDILVFVQCSWTLPTIGVLRKRNCFPTHRCMRFWALVLSQCISEKRKLLWNDMPALANETRRVAYMGKYWLGTLSLCTRAQHTSPGPQQTPPAKASTDCPSRSPKGIDLYVASGLTRE